MGCVLCCFEVERASTAYESRSRQSRATRLLDVRFLRTSHVLTNETAASRARLIELRKRNSPYARQYQQYLCTCHRGSCPRLFAVRPVVDAFVSGTRQASRTPVPTDALYRITAALATYDERRRVTVAFVGHVHKALVATGDEAIAFAVMIEHATVTASLLELAGRAA